MTELDLSNLVYGYDPYINDGTLVFLPRQYALERAAELRALKGARTLSEVVALDLPHLGSYFDDYRSEEDDHLLHADYDDEPYSLAEDISESSGDFPPMSAQWAVDTNLFPPDVLRGVGTVEESVFSGPFLFVDPARESDVIAHLTAAGYQCERDDNLILSVSYLDEDIEEALNLGGEG